MLRKNVVSFIRLRVPVLFQSLMLLESKDRVKLFIFCLFQVFYSLLDLLGIGILGVLGALSVTGLESSHPGKSVTWLLNFLKLNDFSFKADEAILLFIATVLLIGRTLLSVYSTRKILLFLGTKSAETSARLAELLLSQTLTQIQKRSNQENVYALTRGVETIFLRILGNLVTLFADFSLFVVITLGLLIVSPIMAISSALIFGFIGWIVYTLLQKKAHEIGSTISNLEIEGNLRINEVLNSYREMKVKNKLGYYASKIGDNRLKMSSALAESAFLPLVGKYVIESSVLFATVMISAIEFSLQDARHAVGSLAIFLAAVTRLAPAILRVQQSSVQIKSSIGSAEITLKMLNEMEEVVLVPIDNSLPNFEYFDFVPGVKIQNLSFKYDNNLEFSLEEIDLEIQPGTSLAIVGPSGSGKTTLVDIMLSILKPNHGQVLISGMPVAQTIERWPGAIAYVPQNVSITNDTLFENVILGYENFHNSASEVITALQSAGLGDFATSRDVLDLKLGDSGNAISGGQRQRLGIARALLTKPKLLILDEATSSLDGITELEITEMLESLKGQATVITIAHRLATVRKADRIVYMEMGKIKAVGTFQEVRSQIPNFELQASLMGL